jgi:hypothetical protein
VQLMGPWKAHLGFLLVAQKPRIVHYHHERPEPARGGHAQRRRRDLCEYARPTIMAAQAASKELLAVGHKSTRVQRAANRRKRHLRKRRALCVSAGAHPALSSRGGMSVRVRRCGRGTRQPHYSLSLLERTLVLLSRSPFEPDRSLPSTACWWYYARGECATRSARRRETCARGF